MYIGPWQEFKLSRNRQNTIANDDVRNQIEKALASSLDPESAQKAIAAINNQLAASIHGQTGRPPRLKDRPRPRRNYTQLSPSTDLSHGQIKSARESYIASPASVRSTQSEPARLNSDSLPKVEPVKLPKIKLVREDSTRDRNSTYRNNGNSNSHRSRQSPLSNPNSGRSNGYEQYGNTARPPYRQPYYNSTAVINILKIERESNSKNKIMQTMGWKDSTNSHGVSIEGNTKERTRKSGKLIETEREVEEKINQVNKMKQLYIANTSSIEKINVTGSPLKLPEIMKPAHNSISKQNEVSVKTPRIDDMDITDVELAIISKYFHGSDHVIEQYGDVQLNHSRNYCVTKSDSDSLNLHGVYDSNSGKVGDGNHVNHSVPNSHSKEISSQGSFTVEQVELRDRILLKPMKGPHEKIHIFTDSIDSLEGSKPNHSIVRSTRFHPAVLTPPEGTTSPIQSISFPLEELPGGVDGLLRWSSQLDIDQY